MNTTIQQPASEWEKELSISVLEPDGWIERRINWHTPVTQELFMRLARSSTTNFTEYDRLRRMV